LSSFLEIKGLTKEYGATRALDGVSLTVERRQIVAILGPSGCGKSTLLRVVAGLERPTAGEVLCEGANLDGVPPYRRGFGLMFQDYALFPHLNVQANIDFGLRMQGWSGQRREERVAEMLALTSLKGYEARSVHTLSGGEQQRVALARSLAPSPRLLMLDEPLGALDAALRKELLVELKKILGRVGVTALYVTHDQEEALAIADRVALLRAGRVVQEGSAQDLVSRPASAFVAGFLGLGTLVMASARPSDGRWLAETWLGQFAVAGEQAVTPGPALLLIRPGAAQPALAGAPSAANQVTATVLDQTVSPEGIRLRLRLGRAAGGPDPVGAQPAAENVEMVCPWPGVPPQPGTRLILSLQADRLSLLSQGQK